MTESRFDQVARAFARDVDEAMACGRYPRGDAFVTLTSRWLPRGARMLDFGCGPGRLGLLLARAGFRVHGVDPSQAMIEQARALACDGLSIAFDRIGDRAEPDADSYDAVVCSSVIEYVADPSDLLRRLHRALRPAGVLVVSYANRSSFWRWYWRRCGARNPLAADANHTWSWREFRHLLEASGFSPFGRPRFFESPLDALPAARWLGAVPLVGSIGVVAARRVGDGPTPGAAGGATARLG